MKPFVGILVTALALGLALSAVPAGADLLTPREWGISVYGNLDEDISDGNLYSVGVMGHAAKTLYEGDLARLDLRLEGLMGGYWDYDSGVEVALVPALRLFLGSAGLRPYLEAGIGPSYNSLNIKEMGTGFNFLSFGGAGVRYLLGGGRSLELGYRLRHISNAGLDESNHGVTAHQLQLGMAFEF